MSRDLSRRLAKIELKRNAGRSGGYEKMTDAGLLDALRECNRQLAAEIGPNWREWLSENEPESEAIYRQLESEGVEL